MNGSVADARDGWVCYHFYDLFHVRELSFICNLNVLGTTNVTNTKKKNWMAISMTSTKKTWMTITNRRLISPILITTSGTMVTPIITPFAIIPPNMWTIRERLWGNLGTPFVDYIFPEQLCSLLLSFQLRIISRFIRKTNRADRTKIRRRESTKRCHHYTACIPTIHVDKKIHRYHSHGKGREKNQSTFRG